MSISDWLAVVALIFAVMAIIVSVLGWRKSRAIYGFKRKVLRMPIGGNSDTRIQAIDDDTNKDLVSGKWTIVDIIQRDRDKDYDIILGKIKK